MNSWILRTSDYSIVENQNESSLTHYGIPGMKWGVRKDKPTVSERKTRKLLTKDVAAAQKTLKERGKASESASREALLREHKLDTAMDKFVLPWNRRKQGIKIQEASNRLDRAISRSQKANERYNKAIEYEDKTSKELASYVNDLTKRYGRENVKQLGVKQMSVGKGYFNKVYPIIKTGLVAENIPIVGEYTKARKKARIETQ